MLSGSIGTGKTIMINAICKIIESGSNKIITRMHSKKMNEMIKNNEPGFYDMRPLFIDDLGREPKEANDYGNKSEPLIDLISVRYDLGSWTFATTNFKKETLSEFYGAAIVDRFEEIFNTIVIEGSSRRI
jgi:DNA replication protein DnaC